MKHKVIILLLIVAIGLAALFAGLLRMHYRDREKHVWTITVTYADGTQRNVELDDRCTEAMLLADIEEAIAPMFQSALKPPADGNSLLGRVCFNPKPIESADSLTIPGHGEVPFKSSCTVTIPDSRVLLTSRGGWQVIDGQDDENGPNASSPEGTDGAPADIAFYIHHRWRELVYGRDMALKAMTQPS